MRHTTHFTPPQLATLVDRPPEGAGWLHEIKLDGYRMQSWRDGAATRIFSRNGHDWTDRFPGLVKALLALKVKTALIDGEVAIADAKGITSFARLQDAIARKTDLGVVYHAFDLLELDGQDLRKLPLVERKARLKAIVPKARGRILYSDHVVGQGAKVLAKACAMGLEGIISKRAEAPYAAQRTMDWQKTKCLLRQELVIVGYYERQSSIRKTTDKDDFGSLMLGAYEKGALVYTGNVGTGWSDRQRKAIYARLKPLRATKPTVALPKGITTAGLHWLKPTLVAELAFTEWTNDGVIRHPSFQGLREDKPAREVVIERPAGVPGLKSSDWSGQRKR